MLCSSVYACALHCTRRTNRPCPPCTMYSTLYYVGTALTQSHSVMIVTIPIYKPKFSTSISISCQRCIYHLITEESEYYTSLYWFVKERGKGKRIVSNLSSEFHFVYNMYNPRGKRTKREMVRLKVGTLAGRINN